MKFRKSVPVLLSILLAMSGSLVAAHEGHDHDAPKNITAPKLGVMKSLEETYVEVVSKGKELQVYLYDKERKPNDKELKPKSVTGFVVSAKAKMPRTKKQEDIPLTAKETSFEGSFDAKGSHRYTLILSIKDPKTGHDDKLNFTIEPK
jgi:hypothetical protein